MIANSKKATATCQTFQTQSNVRNRLQQASSTVGCMNPLRALKFAVDVNDISEDKSRSIVEPACGRNAGDNLLEYAVIVPCPNKACRMACFGQLSDRAQLAVRECCVESLIATRS
jgi:hypothetical protein